MSAVLSAMAQIAPVLAQLTPEDRAETIRLLVEAGESKGERAARLARDRKRKQRDPSVTEAGHQRDPSGTEAGHQRDPSGTEAGHQRDMGDKGGSGSPIFSPDLSVSLQGSSPKLSSPEGGPSQTPAEAPKSQLTSGEVSPGPAAVEGAPPPRRFNAAALVDEFVAAVNEAGGVWTCPSGKPLTDLAAALQPYARNTMAPLSAIRTAGRRWFAYCGGAPRDAWKAAAWLGEGAPETPRPSGVQRAREGPPEGSNAPKPCTRCRRPTTAGRLCFECYREVDELPVLPMAAKIGRGP